MEGINKKPIIRNRPVFDCLWLKIKGFSEPREINLEKIARNKKAFRGSA